MFLTPQCCSVFSKSVTKALIFLPTFIGKQNAAPSFLDTRYVLLRFFDSILYVDFTQKLFINSNSSTHVSLDQNASSCCFWKLICFAWLLLRWFNSSINTRTVVRRNLWELRTINSLSDCVVFLWLHVLGRMAKLSSVMIPCSFQSFRNCTFTAPNWKRNISYISTTFRIDTMCALCSIAISQPFAMLETARNAACGKWNKSNEYAKYTL